MNPKITEGLEICIKTANILKELNPNELMKIEENTIIIFTKSKKLCSNSSIGYAHYHNKGKPRICIKQKCLTERKMYRTKVKNQSDRELLYGNWALIELMCHELAHHRTKGHAKGFKIKYNKFVNQMTRHIFSGQFYNTNY